LFARLVVAGAIAIVTGAEPLRPPADLRFDVIGCAVTVVTTLRGVAHVVCTGALTNPEAWRLVGDGACDAVDSSGPEGELFTVDPNVLVIGKRCFPLVLSLLSAISPILEGIGRPEVEAVDEGGVRVGEWGPALVGLAVARHDEALHFKA